MCDSHNHDTPLHVTIEENPDSSACNISQGKSCRDTLSLFKDYLVIAPPLKVDGCPLLCQTCHFTPDAHMYIHMWGESDDVDHCQCYNTCSSSWS